jgi:hypothetical protein
VQSGSLLLFSEERAIRHGPELDDNNKDDKNNEFSNTLFINWCGIHKNFLYVI